jgi:hypothetical protein
MERNASLCAIHAAQHATTHATAQTNPGRPVHRTPPGADAAVDAVHSRADAHPHAVDPNARPMGGHASTVAIDPTPAMVVSAAAGMVTMLSGAAMKPNEPACHSAIGVLMVHATNDATTASTAALRTSEHASERAIGFHGILRHHESVASSHRRCTRGEMTSRATTTP